MEIFHINRRSFLKSSAAILAATQLGHFGLHILDTSRKLRVGVIGAGWYGKNDIFRLLQVSDVEVVGVSDVDSKMLEGAITLISKRQKSRKRPIGFKDYRELLKEDLDIAIIGSPDHWHALQAIHSLQSGAHIYLQKPISVDVLEGEAILRAAESSGKIVQVGTQRRSTLHLQNAKRKIIDSGLLGKIAHVEICCYYNMRFNANPPPVPIPEHFDYEKWCGPAPKRIFDGLPHRRWRAYMEYGNGIMGDMCIHMLDTVRWMLDLEKPKKISSTGGIFVQKKSNSNISDTQTAIFEYDEMNIVWQHRTWGPPNDPDYPWSFKIYGENGILKGDVMKYEFVPNKGAIIHETVLLEKDLFPEDVKEPNIELHAAPANRAHMLNFLSAIEKNEKPIADIKEGHISSASCILANISMGIGRPISYDWESHKIKGDEEASKLLKRKYRKSYSHPYL